MSFLKSYKMESMCENNKNKVIHYIFFDNEILISCGCIHVQIYTPSFISNFVYKIGNKYFLSSLLCKVEMLYKVLKRS